ncbi:mycothione reductase [Corynebacterium meridianum]|uniref:Mycothione reductase n=1 Tax=Corynebacterium meridianum TaxID=2765363 RepID=A0A934HY86_9CORY|nr:mycothione reductase [Corynebacterium meridianum]MBI8989143.1 mycothione reductase [Corynebacterium meridianum]MCK7676787.1 mycothione reductase [Corynebacterium meridianum]
MTTPSPTHYDLIIIGTGSGNSIPGPEFDDKKIAIVEKGRFGGTCLNVGCIPTKMYVYTADVAEEIRNATTYGLDAQLNGVDWASIRERVFGRRIDPIADGGEAYRRGEETPNIDVYDRAARFVGERTIETGSGDELVTITGDTIVIAAGARPTILPAIADSGVTYYTNENIMRLEELPKTMTVLGGGFIAVEFAHVFASLGVDVTLVNRSERLLRKTDAAISDRYTELAAKRFNLRLGVTPTGATEDEHGVTLKLDDGSEVTSEVLLAATGRTPNGDQLNLDAAGIEMDGQRIRVDAYGRTTAEGVWALGDVSSPYQLKHVANAEMRAVRHNLLHPDDLKPMPHENVPAAIFTHPQIASIGLTEDEARDAGYDVTVKVQDYGDVAFGWAMEDSTGFAKLIADRRNGRLLGAHIIGPQASTLIQQLITVMAFDLDVRDVARDQYWIHPALPELIENALLGLEFGPR